MFPLLIDGDPVASVTPFVLIKVAPLREIPFSFAKIKSAFVPKISTPPLIVEMLFPLISFKMTEAFLVRFVFLVTYPPN